MFVSMGASTHGQLPRRGVSSAGLPLPAGGIAAPRQPRHLDCIIRAYADAVLFTPARIRQGQDRKRNRHSQAGRPAGADAESATGTRVFIDDRHPFVCRFHEGLEDARFGGGSIRVMPRLSAKRVTAVSSVTADTGRIRHAVRRFAS